MANYFDQFDAPPAPAASAPQAGSGNFFDRFDPGAAPASPAPSAPAQMGGLARQVALPASNVAKGAIDLAGLPGDAIDSAWNLYTNYIGAPLASLVTTGHFGNAKPLTISNPWNTANLESTFRNAGVIDRPDLQPQNTRERIEAAAARGVGGALPLALATGGVSALPAALAQGAGAGAGGEIAKTAMPDHPIIGEIAGSTLGGLAGGAGALGAGGLAKVGNAALGKTSPMIDAYQAAEVTPTLAGDVTGNSFLRRVQAMGAKAPGGAGRIGNAANAAVDQFGVSAEKAAQNLGDSRTLQQAGTALQGAARNWLDTTLPQRLQSAWAPVDEAIPPLAAVRPEGYRDALASLSSKLKGLPQTKRVLLSDRAKALLDAINQDVPAGAGMTWQEAQNLRSAIGAIRGVPEIAASIGDKELGRLYGALSGDMRTTAANYNAGDLFDAANNASTKAYAFRDNILSKVIQSPNALQESVTPEKAASNLLNSDGSTLSALRSEMPDAADELAAYKLRDMTLAPAGQQNAAGTVVSPARFTTELSRLPLEKRAALFADPQTAAKIDALGTVGHSMKTTEKLVNHSNTAAHQNMAAALGLSEALPAGLAGYMAGGSPGAIASGLAGIAAPFLPGFVAGRLTASPWLTRLLAAPGAGFPSGGPAAIGAVYPSLLSAPEYRSLLRGEDASPNPKSGQGLLSPAAR